MTKGDARDLFSEAYDDELDADARARFDAALAEDVDLAVEFAEFCDLIDLTRADAAKDAEPPVNLLPAIQRKIRVRSAGRFYRDGFSERMGSKTLMPLVLSVLMLLLLAIALIGLSFIQIDQDTTPSSDAGVTHTAP
ncbi:MAG: hypothetical protein GXP55_05270 [Deltaproteobacteria bacterium]|nr:hypothetical protein [Deltaproteobacteria bacterium]